MPLGGRGQQQWQAQQGIYWMEKRILALSLLIILLILLLLNAPVLLFPAGVHFEWVAVNECLWQIVMHQSPNLQPGFYDGRWIIVGNTFHSIPFPPHHGLSHCFLAIDKAPNAPSLKQMNAIN